MVVRELINLIGFQVDEAALSRVENRMNAVSSKLDSIGKKMSLFVTTPLAALGTMSVLAAAKVESIQTAFEVFTGSAEKTSALMKDLFKFEAQTPFNLEQVLGYANRLIQMKIPLGDITGMMEMLGNASAGSANTMSSVMEQLFQIKMYGRAQTQDLKIMAQAGVPLFEKLMELSGKSGDEFRKWIEQGNATYDITVQALQNVARDRAGLMEKQSKTLTGLWSSLTSAVFRFNNEIGKVMVKTLKLKEVLAGLINQLSRLGEWFANQSEPTKRLILFIGIAVAAIGPLLVALGGITGAVGLLSGAMTTLMTVSLPVVGTIALVLAGIAALVLLVQDFLVYMQGGESVIGKFIAPWKDMAATVRFHLLSIWEDVQGIFGGILMQLQGWLKLAMGLITGDTTTAVEGLKLIVKGFFKTIWNLILLLGESFLNIWPVVCNIVYALLGVLWNIGVTWAKTLVTFLIDLVVSGFTRAVNAVMNNPVMKAIIGAGKFIGGAAGDLFNSMSQAGAGSTPALAGAGFGGMSMYSPGMSGGAGVSNRNLDIKSTINMTIPAGTAEQQVQTVQAAAESAVREMFERQLRGVIVNFGGEQ